MHKLWMKTWGVRGSTPTPQIENLGFGGNTPCIEIRSGRGECVIFDAGSGIRALGQCLMNEAAGAPVNASIFLTHFHWDHIQGIPFFAPLYGPKNHITFLTGSSTQPIQETLEGQMTKPYFPVDFSQVAAQRQFVQIGTRETVNTGGLTVRAFPLNHPQGASGYRIECDGAAIVYATDYEHGVPAMDRALLDHAQGADILICDAQYTCEEYESHRGWGHSTPLNAIQIAREAGARQLILFHHDPAHDDATMDAIAGEAQAHFESLQAAREGFVATLR